MSHRWWVITRSLSLLGSLIKLAKVWVIVWVIGDESSQGHFPFWVSHRWWVITRSLSPMECVLILFSQCFSLEMTTPIFLSIKANGIYFSSLQSIISFGSVKSRDILSVHTQCLRFVWKYNLVTTSNIGLDTRLLKLETAAYSSISTKVLAFLL